MRSRFPSSRSLSLAFVLGVFCLPLVAGDALGKRGHRDHRHHEGDGERIVGSGRPETRSLDLSDFDRIRVDGVADVEVRVGEEFSVMLTAEDNLIDLVRVGVRRGTLLIDKEEDVDFETEHGILLEVRMPELVALMIDGVGNVEIRGLRGESFDLEVDGVGNVVAEGRVTRLSVEMDGVSELELAGLEAEEADVVLDGVGDVEIHVTGRLRAEVDGMGSLRYRGRPEIVRESIGGFGEILALDD